MAKSELTKIIEKELYKNISPFKEFGCHEVTLGWFGREIVDFITYSTDRIIRCYEIKVSKEDFKSKAKLSFFGHFNYYVMPIGLWHELRSEIKQEIGVYAYDGNCLVNVKKATRQELKADKEVILSSMVRSLQRELIKFKEKAKDNKQ